MPDLCTLLTYVDLILAKPFIKEIFDAVLIERMGPCGPLFFVVVVFFRNFNLHHFILILCNPVYMVSFNQPRL